MDSQLFLADIMVKTASVDTLMVVGTFIAGTGYRACPTAFHVRSALAVQTENQSAEHRRLGNHILPVITAGVDFLCLCKCVTVNDRRVCILKNHSLFFRRFHHFLVLIRNAVQAEIDRISAIFRLCQKCGDRSFTPFIFAVKGVSVSCVLMQIYTRTENLLITEGVGNRSNSHSRQIHCKNPAYNTSGVLVNHPFLLIIGVTHITVNRLCAEAFARLSFLLNHCLHFLGNVPAVPLVNQVVERH